MHLEPIEYRGELVALAGTERLHVIAPWLLERPSADPDLRFIAFMWLCRRQAAERGVTGPVAGEVLELWARSALIGERELREHADRSDAELGRDLNVPVEQIAAARAELRADRADVGS